MRGDDDGACDPAKMLPAINVGIEASRAPLFYRLRRSLPGNACHENGEELKYSVRCRTPSPRHRIANSMPANEMEISHRGNRPKSYIWRRIIEVTRRDARRCGRAVFRRRYRPPYGSVAAARRLPV